MSALIDFHPAVRAWFEARFDRPTDAQLAGWPAIRKRQNVLLAAPTGSGKTLTGFLVGIDRLLSDPELEDRTRIVYISPLKALAGDIERNLEEPLEGIRAKAAEMEIELPRIRIGVRTGDTTASRRQAMVKKPPHILITTPESLFILLTAERGRETLRDVEMILVDEIHALARDRRGSHLSLTIERLEHVAHVTPFRVGLSATQKPIEGIARFLVGPDRPCEIVDLGHQRELQLAVEVPAGELEAIASQDMMGDLLDRIAALVGAHQTTLIFVNTRAQSERIAHLLRDRLGEDAVASHHGSMSKARRQKVEKRLKAGELKTLVATASLELGIDIGSIDLVCQIGSPGRIATFLQRIGRSGHALGLVPHGRLFPSTRDQLVECAALVRAVRAGRLDAICPPKAPLDVVAQQLVAESATEPWQLDDIFALFRRADPFAELSRSDFDEIVTLLAEGLGDIPPRIHLDRINGSIRGRRGARMISITNAGTIPEMGDYRVVAEPDDVTVGSVNEDFAIESAAGDIFLLGSTSWKIRQVSNSTVRVVDAKGAPPTIPFWLGEAPGRSVELSEEVGRLRRAVASRLDDPEQAAAWLMAECDATHSAAEQIVAYVRATRDGLGVVPSDTDVVFERFFDDSGGMQLVVHAPFGQRINRALGLGLRKQFCVGFDFELQAAANDDSVLLSAGPQHSWPLEDCFGWLSPENARRSVEKSILYAPMFPTRWRWNATRALLLLRQRGGKRVPPFIQRLRSDDLMAHVFPDQVACQEHARPLELPDHPLMRQTMTDCLTEAMDIDGLLAVLERIRSGEIRLHAKETTEPSPMAHEIIGGRPYTFLDDAPLEERRARAVSLRRGLPVSARDLGALDQPAIDRVVADAQPDPRDAEEVHDALLSLIAADVSAFPEWSAWIAELEAGGRAGRIESRGATLAFAAENVRLIELLFDRDAPIDVPATARIQVVDRDDARRRLLAGHTEVVGPTTAAELAARIGLTVQDAGLGVAQLVARGDLLEGRFRPASEVDEVCDRRLLARIHRATLDRLRKEIEPVAKQDWLRFLLRWQHLTPETQLTGKVGVRAALGRLQGWEAPAVGWESAILPARIRAYQPSWLDGLCLSGEVSWGRLSPRRLAAADVETGVALSAATRVTPVSLAPRGSLAVLLAAVRDGASPATPTAGCAAEILAELDGRGALFFSDLVGATRRLATDVEVGLRELIGAGLITGDGFAGLRDITHGHKNRQRRPRLRDRFGGQGLPPGRWVRLEAPTIDEADHDELAEDVARILLERWGVVFHDLYRAESFGLRWRSLLHALRRLEARGEIRGGRFITGFSGEQYALPGAVQSLRKVRRVEKTGERVQIPAIDPMALAVRLATGASIRRSAGDWVTLIDGLPESDEREGRAT